MGRSDEEIANALQEKYRQEFLERQARRSNRSSSGDAATVTGSTRRTSTARQLQETQGNSALFASAPPEHEVKGGGITTAENVVAVDQDALLAQRLQQEFNTSSAFHASTIPPSRQSSAESTDPLIFGDDDADARIAQELQDEELARRYSSISAFQTPRSAQSSFLDERGSPSDDVRIAQEMTDAEMAQRLSTYEEEALRRAEREQLQQQRPRRSILMRILPLICCGVAISIPILFILGVFDADEASDFFGDLGDAWIDTDPWKGQTSGGGPFNPGGGSSGGNGEQGSGPTGSAYAWPNNGQGLTLTILNAMDDSWQTELKVAVDNWEAGDPVDPLTFVTERIPHEVSCSPVDGKLKICNGNYGPTRWRGINEVVLNRRTNEIVNSIAKMNEYYLPSIGSKDQRLYTLCHELGHGFGLPHWDEDFYNEDMGNCMDYTSRPGNNKQPDASNFIYLGSLYGNVTSSALTSQSLSSGGGNGDGGNGGGGGNKKSKSTRGRRHQRRRYLRWSSSSLSEETSGENVEEEGQGILLVHPQDADGKSQLLVANERMQVHYRELNENNDHIQVYQYMLA